MSIEAPPPLEAMAERLEKLEEERLALFKVWKAALEEAGGCITYAAENCGMTRDRGNRLTRRFELVEYAAELRRASTGHAGGRQDR